jgi:hypothetical protein
MVSISKNALSLAIIKVQGNAKGAPSRGEPVFSVATDCLALGAVLNRWNLFKIATFADS